MSSKQRYLFAGTGYSKDDDPLKAGYNAVMNAAKDLEKDGCKKKPEFGFIFCSGSKYGKNDKTIKKFVEGANKAFKEINPNIKWVGGTTAGEICDKYIGFSSAVAMLIQSNYLFWGVGFEDNISKNPKEKTKIALKKAIEDTKIDKELVSYLEFLRSKSDMVNKNKEIIIILAKGITIDKSDNGDKIIDGIKEELGVMANVIGGATSDDLGLIENYRFYNGNFTKEGIIIVNLISELEFEINADHSYVPTETIFIVNDGTNNIVTKLNNSNPLEEYCKSIKCNKSIFLKYLSTNSIKDFLKKAIKTINSSLIRNYVETSLKKQENAFFIYGMHPLAIYNPIAKDYVLRMIKRVINENLEFYSEIPKGSVLTLMKYDPRLTIKSFKNALSNDSKIHLIFECVGRTLIQKYYENVKLDEIAKKKKEIIKNKKTIGFNSQAEFSTFKSTGPSYLNFSVTALKIYDQIILSRKVKRP